MTVKKVVITQATISKVTRCPQIAGRIYDDLLVPVPVNKIETITVVKRGWAGFNVTLRHEEKPVHLLARLVEDYERVQSVSQSKKKELDEILSGISRIWPGAYIENYSV